MAFTRGLFCFQNRAGGEFCRTPRPVTTGGITPNNKRDFMIYFVSVLLKQIFAAGKNYPWVRPSECPRCGHYRLWGHGYAQRYFRGFPSCLYLKCYRCPACNCVLTLRPDSHFPRIRTSREMIRNHIEHRQTLGHWPRSDLLRSNLRYWWNNLTRRTCAFLTNTWCDGFLTAFDQLSALGKVPVSRLR